MTELTEEDTRTILSVDSQVLSAIQACNQYAAYTHISHLAPEDENKLSLEMGLVIHEMLRFHYNNKYTLGRLERTEQAVKAGESYMLRETTIVSPKLWTELVQAYLGYVDTYEREAFDILAVEERFSKVLYSDDEVVILYNGIIDLLTRTENSGEATPYDHKTYGSWYKPHGMENQFQGYCWAVDHKTLVVNRIGLGKYLGKNERITVNYPTEVLEEWRVNAAETILDHWSQAKDNRFRKNFTSCGMYGGCRFKPLCRVAPYGRELLIRTDFKVVEAWDPMTRDN